MARDPLLPQYGSASRTEKEPVARLGIGCGMNNHQAILKNAAKPSKLGALPPNPRFGGNIKLAPRSLTFCFSTTTPTQIQNSFLLNLTNTTPTNRTDSIVRRCRPRST